MAFEKIGIAFEAIGREFMAGALEEIDKGLKDVSRNAEDVAKSTSKTDSAIERVGNAARQSAPQVKELGEESKQTADKVDDVGDKSEKSESKVKQFGVGAAAAAVALGTLAAKAVEFVAANAKIAFNRSISEVNEWADTLDSLGDTLGLTPKQAAVLSVAIEGVGGDVGKLTPQILKFNQGLKDSKGGLGPTAKLAKQLGINIKDSNGELLSADLVLNRVATRLAKLPDGLEKTNLQIKFFGKSGKDLTDTLGALAGDGLLKAEERARKLGLVLSDDVVGASIEFGKQGKLLEQITRGLFVSIGAKLLPAITKFADKFLDLAVDVVPKVADAIGGFATLLVDKLSRGFEIAQKVYGEFVDGFSKGGLAGGLGAAADSIASLLGFDDATSAQVGQKVESVIGSVTKVITDFRDGFSKDGIVGGAASVASNIARLLGFDDATAQKVGDDVLGFVKGIDTRVRTIIDDIGKGFASGGITGAIKSGASIILQALGFDKATIDSVIKSAESAARTIDEALKKVGKAVDDFIGGLPDPDSKELADARAAIGGLLAALGFGKSGFAIEFGTDALTSISSLLGLTDSDIKNFTKKLEGVKLTVEGLLSNVGKSISLLGQGNAVGALTNLGVSEEDATATIAQIERVQAKVGELYTAVQSGNVSNVLQSLGLSQESAEGLIATVEKIKLGISGLFASVATGDVRNVLEALGFTGPEAESIGLSINNLISSIGTLFGVVITGGPQAASAQNGFLLALSNLFTALETLKTTILSVFGLESLAPVITFGSLVKLSIDSATFAINGMATLLTFVFQSLTFVFTLAAANVNIATTAINTSLDTVKTTLESFKLAFETAKTVVSEAINVLVGTLQTKLREGREVFDAWIAEIKRVLSNLPATFVQLGGNLIDGLKQGITNKFKQLLKDFQGLAQDLINTGKTVFGVNSPSKVFAKELGLPIAEGIALGISNGTGMIDRAISNSVSSAGGQARRSVVSSGRDSQSTTNNSRVSNVTFNVNGVRDAQALERRAIVLNSAFGF